MLLVFHQIFAAMSLNLHSLFLFLFFPDAKILPGPEEQHASHVTHRQELARQALPLSGWSPQRAEENLPSLEGWSLITITSPSVTHIVYILSFHDFYSQTKY